MADSTVAAMRTPTFTHANAPGWIWYRYTTNVAWREGGQYFGVNETHKRFVELLRETGGPLVVRRNELLSATTAQHMAQEAPIRYTKVADPRLPLFVIGREER